MIRRLLTLFPFLLAGICLLDLAGDLLAQPKNEPPPTVLELTPARPSIPSLRYSLLPELRDQSPGNGAVFYRKARESLDKVPAKQVRFEQLDQWDQLPLTDLPRDKAREMLALFREPLELFHKGARSETCDFEIAQRLRDLGFMASLAELQKMREGSRVLVFKARLELIEDRPDLALQTLKTVYAMGRHIAQEPTLISALVGIAITTQANKALEQVLGHPRTPNLSASLLALPHPFIDMHRPFQGERLGVYGTFPGFLEIVNNPDSGPLKPEQLAKVAETLNKLESESRLREALLGGVPDVIGPVLLALQIQSGGRIVNDVLLASMIRNKHEIAKKALIAAGRPREQVERWPHVQVALMHALLEYDQMFDELLNWQSFPHWQSSESLEAFSQKVRAARLPGPDAPAIPLAPLVLPAVQNVLLARDRLDRQFAALRVIEAIRLFAANHNGKLPATLADIKEVPLPICPVSGKSFVYRVEGERAFLSSPPVPKSAARIQNQPLNYEITLRVREGQ